MMDRPPPREDVPKGGPRVHDGGSWRDKRAREIRTELAEHLDRRTAALIAAGYSPEAARAEAIRRLGDVGRIEEECMTIVERWRTRRRLAGWIEDLSWDLRVAVRAHRRRPIPAVGVVLTIALAIGAATAVFGVVQGVLLAPLAFPRSSELFSVYTRYLPETGYDFEYFPLSGPELVDYQEMTRTMRGVAAYAVASMNVTPLSGEPARVRVVLGTSNLLDVLGVQPALGRGWLTKDGDAAAGCVTVLSDGQWRSGFGGDPDAIGRDLRLNGNSCTIVGVMPPAFAFPNDLTSLYVVLQLNPTSPSWERESHHFLAVARLAPDADRAQAQVELDALRARWSQDFPDHHARGHFIVTRPLEEDIVGDARTPLLVLMGAVGVVLLIVTVNVSGLMLASLQARRREFAVRAALGVGRARLIRQLLTESMLLALIGGALGIVASNWMLRGLLTLYPGRLPRANEISVDAKVVLFGTAIAAGTGLVFGLLPAIHTSKVGVNEVLRSVGRGLTAYGAAMRARRAFVVVQTALAFVLVMAAALLARSYAQVRSVELGFEPEGVLTFAVAVPPGSYPEDARARNFFMRLEERLAVIPGAAATGAVSDLPLRSGGGADDFIIDGKPLPQPGQPAWNARYQMATPGALAALGLKLVAGRWLAPTDVPGAPPVAVINEAAARLYFSGENAMGRRIRYYGQDSTWITIVGIVRDVKQLRLTDDAPPAVYTSLAQAPRPEYAGRFMNLLVRFQGNPSIGAGAVRQAVAEVDPTLPPSELTTLGDIVSDATGSSRFTTMLVAAFAGFALLLGALGLYAVLAHVVNLRTREIGVRLALGAEPRTVLAVVVRQGVMPVLVGIAFGFLATVVTHRTLRGLLFGVEALDPASLMLSTSTLLAMSVAACCIPAWRAARISPMAAMRED